MAKSTIQCMGENLLSCLNRNATGQILNYYVGIMKIHSWQAKNAIHKKNYV